MKQIPNLLTAARLLAAPYILYLLWTGGYRTALVWFAIASATDVLDGFLARRLRVVSKIGALLDPVADKVLLSGSFLILGLRGIIPIWLMVLVLGRDLMILGFAIVALARKIRREFPPSVWGKASTASPDRVRAVCGGPRSRPDRADCRDDSWLDRCRIHAVERDRLLHQSVTAGIMKGPDVRSLSRADLRRNRPFP